MTDSIPVLSIILVKNEGIPQLMAMSMGERNLYEYLSCGWDSFGSSLAPHSCQGIAWSDPR